MLRAERRASILLITLDRPEKRNALHPELIRELRATLEAANDDAEVRVVVITGRGSSFCAGLDLDHLIALDDDGRVEYMRSAFGLFRELYAMPQPVIAAVNGAAVAGGFDLAALCDLRFCTPDARFGQAEIRLGLTQIMYPLYKIIGLGRATELAFTGDTIPADEALRIGLVNRVFPREALLSETLAFAELLASRPRDALRETKRLSRELIEMDTGAAFDRMFDAIAGRLRSEEHRDALRAYAGTLRGQREGAS